MFHYTYLIEFPNGMKYVGVRSTKLKPELDTTYLGSGKYLPERCVNSCTKSILNTYKTRAEAVQAETNFIRTNDCISSKLWYNQRDWNYDKHGQTKETHSGVAKAAHKLTGRTKETHEYIRKANEKRKKYRGDNRTPAQIVGSKQAGEKIRGTKSPAKGHKSITNCAFEPWYYIKPCGETVVVTNITKGDYAHKLGLTPRQMTHRFHYTNIGKPAKQGKCKGWVFGNLIDLERAQINDLC